MLSVLDSDKRLADHFGGKVSQAMEDADVASSGIPGTAQNSGRYRRGEDAAAQ
jgi:hypothetical protein